MDAPGLGGPDGQDPPGISPSTCSFCSCGCGLHLFASPDGLTGVSPSEHHPISQGRLCARGWHAHEAPLWGPRLSRPTVLSSGLQTPVTWGEALEAAAAQLASVLASGREVGVLASGRVTNEEGYLAVRLARDALRSPNVDTTLRAPFQALLAAGNGGGNQGLDLAGIHEFIAGCGLILVVEENLADSHPQVAYSVLRGVRRGARLITLSPAETQLSRVAGAALPLDPSLACNPVPELLEVLGTGQRPTTGCVILAPFSTDLRCLRDGAWTLAEGVREWGKEAGAQIRVLPLPTLCNGFGAYQAGVAPNLLPGGWPLSDENASARLREAWGRVPTLGGGMGAARMLDGVGGLVVIRDHPPATAREPAVALDALRGLDALVVLDAFPSETSRAASVVLPIGAFSEIRGTITSLDGRIQRWRPARLPPGEAREGWRVLADLLTSLGVGHGYTSLARVAQEMGAVMPGYPVLSWNGQAVETRGRAPHLPFPVGSHHLLPEEGGREPVPAAEGTMMLALSAAYPWEDDPGVALSPTLRRMGLTRRKLHPEGVVTMSRATGTEMGIREGWKVRIRSAQGEAVVSVAFGPGILPGLLLAPFAFRQALAGVLGRDPAVPVTVERM